MMFGLTPPPASAMSLADLKRLVKTGEGTYLEFKKTISTPEKIAREACAFANTKGGMLLIGVNDDKTVIGVPSFYEEQYLLAEALTMLCEPPVKHTVEIVETGRREVVIVKIEEAEKKPIYVRQNGHKFAYIRENDKSVRASLEKTALMKVGDRNEGITFQYGPNEQKLFRFLNEYDKITVSEYSNLIAANKRKSARILIDLTSIGVLKLFSGNEHPDYFMLSNQSF
jgi:predicted HTH transcriptional regulator